MNFLRDMATAKVYVETTIPSYLAARPSLHTIVFAHQQLTERWWEQRRHSFQLFVSELVLQECSAGNPQIAERRLKLIESVPVLAPNRAVLNLARLLVDRGPIPKKAAGDAIHVAIATVYGCEYLLTWNCRHIANAEIRRTAGKLMSDVGYELPVICTPEELMGGETLDE